MCQATNCFAHVHMTLEEYGLWTYASKVSYQSKKFYFNGSGMAKGEFCGMNKDLFYRVRNALIRKGWFRVLEGPSKTKYGRYSCGVYCPLSHDEWAAEHPGQCRNNAPVDPPSSADENERPFAPAGTDAVPAATNDAYSETDGVLSATDDGYAVTDAAYAGINNDLNADVKYEEKCMSLTTTSTNSPPAVPPNPGAGGKDAVVDGPTHKPILSPARADAPPPGATGPRIDTSAADGSAGADSTGGRDDDAVPEPTSILSQKTIDANQQLGNLIFREYDLRDGVGRKFFTAIQDTFKFYLRGRDEPFKFPTKPHREAAARLAKKYGVDRFLFALCLFLKNFQDGEATEDALVYGYDENGERLYKTWPLNEFVDQGLAEEYLEKIKTYWGLNILAMPWAIRNEINPKALTPARIEAINFVHGFPFHEDGIFDAVYESAKLGSIDTPEEERRFVELLFDLKNRCWCHYASVYGEIFEDEGISWDSWTGKQAKGYFIWQWEGVSDHPDDPPRIGYGPIREKLKAELVNILGVQPDKVETPVCVVPLDDAKACVFPPRADGETVVPLILLTHV